MNQGHFVALTGGTGGGAGITALLVHYQGLDPDTAASEAALIVTAAAVLGHLGYKVMTHFWPWLNGGADFGPQGGKPT